MPICFFMNTILVQPMIGGNTMKTITLAKLIQLIDGKLKTGKTGIQIKDINFGRPSILHSGQVYFYTREISWEKQLSSIRKAKPIAVVLPYTISVSLIPLNTAIIQVNDAYVAFWKVARWNWNQHSNVKVIGITGSVGKSTTTAMVSSILKYKSYMVKTEGNLNTFTFLPFYLVRLKAHHQLLLLEVGMKSLYNIQRQCEIVKPQIGAVTNVGEAHAGSLGNLSLVARAKQELVDGIRPGGTLYVNADDPGSKKLITSRCKGRVLTFGVRHSADIKGKNIRYTKSGMSFEAIINKKTHSLFIPVFGTHNVYNALAAIGIARSSGATMTEIKRGLASFQAPRMRLQLLQGSSGRLLINDAWNANPTSMIAGLDVLRNLSSLKPTVAVLGDMLELGDLAYQSHHKVGKHVADIKVDYLITIGPNAKWIAEGARENGMQKDKISSYQSIDPVLKKLSSLPKNATIYFKASRKWKLENLVQKAKSL